MVVTDTRAAKKHNTCRTCSHLKIKRIQISNILEDDTGHNAQEKEGGFLVTLRAFQILTLKVDLD